MCTHSQLLVLFGVTCTLVHKFILLLQGKRGLPGPKGNAGAAGPDGINVSKNILNNGGGGNAVVVLIVVNHYNRNCLISVIPKGSAWSAWPNRSPCKYNADVTSCMIHIN